MKEYLPQRAFRIILAQLKARLLLKQLHINRNLRETTQSNFKWSLYFPRAVNKVKIIFLYQSPRTIYKHNPVHFSLYIVYRAMRRMKID